MLSQLVARTSRYSRILKSALIISDKFNTNGSSWTRNYLEPEDFGAPPPLPSHTTTNRTDALRCALVSGRSGV